MLQINITEHECDDSILVWQWDKSDWILFSFPTDINLHQRTPTGIDVQKMYSF